MPNGVKIVALLPNPKGRDAGNEQVTVFNSTRRAVDLQGWKLVDKAGNVFLLSDSIVNGKQLAVTLTYRADEYPTIGHFKLQSKLGTGAFGTV